MTIGPHRVADQTAIAKDTKGNTRFYPRGLNITWGNDDRYWHISNSNTPKSSSVAELKQVSWLEVTCSTDNVEVGKKYKVGFNVSMKPDAFGWNGIEVYVMAKVGKSGKFMFKKVSLGDKPTNQSLKIPEEPLEITVDASTPKELRTIHLGLYEVWTQKWKGGLRIHDAFVQTIG
ncbi:protein PHLOEM PROTEIN 2-LIKE A9-like [Momordica charantia]|uniref:Protein PHLOEM PROTEIN 2-LIKE A9-like n=1 Tax=Momordica charantia TaxID=3673 RepID=A0A6J1CKW1_MOMCH|nr:protein PHLOEM PROTEIN 2-LIKE A9-like [Momordica charantia]